MVWLIYVKEGDVMRMKDNGIGKNRHWNKTISKIIAPGIFCNNTCDALCDVFNKKPSVAGGCTFTHRRRPTMKGITMA